MEDKKKAAISSFFAKKKAATTSSRVREVTPAADAVPLDVVSYDAAPAPNVVPGATVPTSKSDAATVLAPGGSDAWVEAAEERHRLIGDSGAHGTRVGDLSDAEFAAASSVDIEAEEARRAFWNARKAVVKKKGAKAAAPAAPAPLVVSGWKAALAARKAAGGGGPVDVNNAALFPTLGQPVSGFHPSAKFADPSAGDILNVGKPSVWAALATEDDEDDGEEIAPQAPAAAAAAATVATRRAQVRFTDDVASAPAAAASVAFAQTDAECTPAAADGDELNDETTPTVAASIVNELRSTLDAEGAVRRIGRSAPPARRAALIDALLQAGLDAETAEGRGAVADALALLVPARAVTPAALRASVDTLVSAFDDIVIDIPRAATYLAQLLRRIVGGQAHQVPASGLPAAVASALGTNVVAAAVAASTLAIPAATPSAGAAPPPPATAAVTAAVVEQPASDASSASIPPAVTAIPAVGDDEIDDLFASAKRKKKKAPAAS